MSSPRLTDFCKYAVIFHEDGPYALWSPPPDLYRVLFNNVKKWFNDNGVPVIHLSCETEGWGDINFQYRGNPRYLMYNRETFFRKFLAEDAEDDAFHVFVEPDVNPERIPPPTECDAMLIYRQDGVCINPALRLLKTSGLPYLDALVENYPPEEWKENAKCWNMEWHGDSDAHVAVARKYFPDLKGPCVREFKGLKIEFRSFGAYGTKRSKFFPNYKWTNKLDLYKKLQK